MRDMLRAVQNNQPIDAQSVADLQFDLELAIAQKDAARRRAAARRHPPCDGAMLNPRRHRSQSRRTRQTPQLLRPATAPGLTTSGAPPRWEISFKPHKELLARGNDPLRMLREVASLGTVSDTCCARLRCRRSMSWMRRRAIWPGRIELEGAESEQQIRDVFDWAEGDCDLSIRSLSAAGRWSTGGQSSRARRSDAPLSRPEASHEGSGCAGASCARAGCSSSGGIAGERRRRQLLQRLRRLTRAPRLPPLPLLRRPPPRPSAGAAHLEVRSGEIRNRPPNVGDSGSIRVSVEKIDELMNTVGELVITQAMLSQLGQKLEGPDAEQFRSSLANLERNMRGPAGKRHARAHAAHQLRVQPLPAHGARPRAAAAASRSTSSSPARRPSSTRP